MDLALTASLQEPAGVAQEPADVVEEPALVVEEPADKTQQATKQESSGHVEGGSRSFFSLSLSLTLSQGS